MNTTVLQKCVEALKAESPDLSYVRGMLETLIEMQSNQSYVPPVPESKTIPVAPVATGGTESNATGSYVESVGRVAPLH